MHQHSPKTASHGAKSGSTEAQKVFAMLKLIPDARLPDTSTAGSALVIDTSLRWQRLPIRMRRNNLLKMRAPAGKVVDAQALPGYDLNLPTLADQRFHARHTRMSMTVFAPPAASRLVHIRR
jgi:hypothetical protein